MLLGCLSACQNRATRPLTPVTLQLKWTHSAQFAGFYAAQTEGYYAAEGLDVKFVEGGPNIDPVAPVLNGTADFGVGAGIDIILQGAAGAPIEAVAVLYRRSPFVYFARADSGITGPEDFAGKVVQVSARSRPIYYTILAHVGLPVDQTVESRETGLSVFYDGEVDVGSGYITSQVLEVRRQGYELNVIFPDDYGVHMYDDTLFTTSDLIAADPDLVLRFVRATLRGWTYAVEHPAEVGEMVGQYKPQVDLDYENEVMAASLPYVNTGEDHIGWMRPEIWAEMAETFRAQEVLVEPLEVDSVYTMAFLEQIYQPSP